MIQYTRHTLSNGLRILIHQDKSTPMAALSVQYNVGARNEKPELTGLAHLFEHLMFSGSKNVPDFDTPIQLAGGDNNAYTNSDLTNFHAVVPAQNLDTLLWLEADRMADLRLNKRKLDNQKKVVIEEFKETCLNQPYGDVWHHLAALAYKDHPYRWPVIGEIPEHVEAVEMEDAKQFYHQYYQPANAVLAVAGNIEPEEVLEKIRYWFDDIASVNPPVFHFEGKEIFQKAARKVVHADVPVPALYIAFPMGSRMDKSYYAADLLSDLLADGRSSRLYQSLVKQDPICSNIDAYITGTLDEGLFIVEAKPSEGKTLAEIESAIWTILEEIKATLLSDDELQKLQNKTEHGLLFSESNPMNKAVNLCFFESIGDPELINTEVDQYLQVSAAEISQIAREIFDPTKSFVLEYLTKDAVAVFD
ncbi:MAG: pitrilysin family protein [Saprospiraceae bacterium]